MIRTRGAGWGRGRGGEGEGIFPMQKPREFPKIICLCGSARFTEEFFEQGWVETLRGNIVVLSIGVCKHAENHRAEVLGPEVVKQLDELYLRKIDLADEVLILNVKGYVGKSTQAELDYARQQGKTIRFLEPEWKEKK